MNVPKLRFKEFNDEWITEKVGDTTKVLMCKRIFASDTSDDGEIPFYKIGTIGSKPDVFISRELFEQYKNKYNYPKNGEVLITCSGTVGKCVLFDGKDSYYQDSNIVWLDNPTKKISNNFLYYYISNVDWFKLNSTTIVRIYGDNLRNLKITYPINKIEQEKITNTIKLIDKKIELQTKKIEDLKLFKKGLIKKFFSENNLKQIKIKEIGEIITGTTPSKSINSYWDNGNVIWVTPTDINENRDINDSIFKITDNGLRHGKFIPKNSILVTCIASIGKNAILKVDGSCNQQINAIIPNKNYNYNYIYYLMEFISNYMKSIAGTSATSIINKDEFSKLQVKIHPKEKQDNIESILSQFEDKILLENSKLNQLNQLKKGLMQSMFV